MTLPVSIRHEVCGTLVCRSAVHVGCGRASAQADLAVVRDGLDRPLVPGTSLAGALRAYLGTTPPLPGEPAPGRTVSAETVRTLFGFVEERTQNGAPALIRVDDALLLGPAVRVGTRDGVGIDRRTGAAAAGFLYEKETLPEGTRFTFRLVADEPPGGDPRVHQAVKRLVGALRAGTVPVGAGRSTGLGRVALEDITVRRADLSRREGLTEWLTGRAVVHPTPVFEPAEDRTLTITVRWKPVGSVLVKDSLEGTVVDTLPLTARDTRGRVRLLLPGSSIKGVLRSHAERIVRTLLERDAPASLRTVLESERLPGVVGLFGAGPQAEQAPGEGPALGNGPAGQGPDNETEKERAAASGWRAALEIEDCHSTGHVSSQDWDEVLAACAEKPAPAATGPRPRSTPVSPTGGPSPLTMAALAPKRSTAGQGGKSSRDTSQREERHQFSDHREKARKKLLDTLRGFDPGRDRTEDGPAEPRTGVERDDDAGLGLSVSDHVSIDRWTGGAASGRLFSVLEPTLATTWHPIRLRVDPSRAGGPTDPTGSDGSGKDDEVAVALILLVLRDLADGWLSVGFGRTRGHGHVEVTEVEFSGTPDRAPWNALTGRTLRELLADPPREILAAMDRWAATVRAQPARGTSTQEQETRP